MSRGVYEYLDYVGAALKADAAIIAFCRTSFGKTLSVFVGSDESDLPSDELCPMILIAGGGRGLNGEHLKARSAKITIAMKKDSAKAANASGIITYPGLPILDEFADLVAKNLVNLPLHSSGYYVSELGDGPDDVIQFPVFKAHLSLSISLDSDF